VLADRSPSDGWVLEARWIGPGSGRLGKGYRVTVTGQLRQRTWEMAEGEKRSVTELEADEVGASLK
jgi:hypothetical protein